MSYRDASESAFGDRKLSVNEMEENFVAIRDASPFNQPTNDKSKTTCPHRFFSVLGLKMDRKKCVLAVVRTIFYIFISISVCC
jgi:hypothetical protein